MLQGQAPSAIDALQGRLPPFLKWAFMGGGAAAGFYYARADASPIPLSYIALGAAAGFCLVAGFFAVLRILKLLAVAGVALLVLNYAVLIPFGYGNHLSGWADTSKAALRWLDPSPWARRWGKSVETGPGGR